MDWINIKNRLPKQGEIVLAYCNAEFQFEDEIYDLEIQAAYMEENGEWYLESKNLDKIHTITHWMSLPDPPLHK